MLLTPPSYDHHVVNISDVDIGQLRQRKGLVSRLTSCSFVVEELGPFNSPQEGLCCNTFVWVRGGMIL